MVRTVALALVVALGTPSAPVDAKPSVSRKSKTSRATKKKMQGKHRRKKLQVSATSRVRVKTTQKPLVKIATLQSDGRVKYGPDRMPPGFAWPPTAQMRAVGSACEGALDEIGVTWKPAQREGRIASPIVVPDMKIGGIAYASLYARSPSAMDCQFARALALIGPDLYALGVREVQYGSVYRNTLARSHGQTKTFLSRHALGLAMDIKSFVDDHGRVVNVELDYLKGDALLHGIEDAINKNTRFREVLTPGNDPISHYDHFHIEASVDFTSFR
jgi:hypothetical protein